VAITDFVSILLIAISLSADCFAVALSGSSTISKLRYPSVLRTALAFGFAQFVMPVIGWLIGRTIINFISGYDHWIAFVLLAFIGGRMIWESFQPEDEKKANSDITWGFLLLTLAVATSIDALAVGLSLGLLNINVWLASSIIGVVAFTITCLGFLLGRQVGLLFGKRARLIGGVILIAIGIRILITHLLGG
jgi:manganese efflux pump family protein